jgi:hypothetical protein
MSCSQGFAFSPYVRSVYPYNLFHLVHLWLFMSALCRILQKHFPARKCFNIWVKWPALPFICMYPKRIKNRYSNKLPYALFTIAQRWRQLMSISSWMINSMLSVHMAEYYSARLRNDTYCNMVFQMFRNRPNEKPVTIRWHVVWFRPYEIPSIEKSIEPNCWR